MPCHVDTSYEDNLWREEILRHHKVVESILEHCIARGVLTGASDELQKERQLFAENYRRIFTYLYSWDILQEGVENILQRGDPHSRA